MGWIRRRSTAPDAEVPAALDAPRHALVRPLRFKLDTRASHAVMTAEVQPLGAEPYEAQLRSRVRPSRFSGMHVGSRYPGLVDDADATVVLLVEPACGYPTPVPTPELADLWPARDERTARLRSTYPAPEPRELEATLAAQAAPPADLPLAAVLARFQLLTTVEAAAIDDRVRADGVRWEQAVARFDMLEPLDFAGTEQVVAALAHLDDIAGRPALDVQPLIGIGCVVRWRHLVDDGAVPDGIGEPPSADDLRTVVGPFEQVCGPVSF